MNRYEIDWQSGTVTYWVLDEIDEAAPISDQLSALREDLAQVSYGNTVLIDVGWYPSFSRDGSFAVQVIQNGDWQHPLTKERCVSFGALRASLGRAVQVAMAAEARLPSSERPG